MKVKSHKAKRGNKTTVVKEHTRRGSKIRSSFLERIEENSDGGYSVIIKGRSYPYPYMPKEKVGGILNGSSGSSGKYYNKHIRGKFF